jgi:hypothetical protein
MFGSAIEDSEVGNDNTPSTGTGCSLEYWSGADGARTRDLRSDSAAL